MKPFIEQDCTIEFEGRTFTSGGAVVTDDYIVGYMSSDMTKLQTWHGDVISDVVTITGKWRINSWVSSHMYQVRVNVNGKWFTGRTCGSGMIARLKPCK